MGQPEVIAAGFPEFWSIYELRVAGKERLDAEEARWQAVNRVLRTV